MRYLFLLTFFFSISLSAQRDSIINGIKCHLISSTDTGSSWIQQRIKTKKGIQINGHYYEMYADGKLKVKGFYKKGKRNGKWIGYYSSGKKSVEGYYDGGKKSDIWQEYYPSGQLSWKGNYFKDMRSGFWRYYYENGVQKAMTRYFITSALVKGKKVTKSKGPSFRRNVEIHYTISPADSLLEYYPDGKLKIRILYGKKGGLNGTCEYFYPNGAINFQGKYLNGNKFGDWTYFCQDGTIEKMIRYSEKDESVEAPTPDDRKTICVYEEILPMMKWEIEKI